MPQSNELKNKKELQRKTILERQISYLQGRLFRYSQKYHTSWQIALHMATACLIKLRFVNKKRKNNISGPLRICIKMGGGLGDVIIRLNWVCGFYKKFHSRHPMQLFLATKNKGLLNAFAPNFIEDFLSPKESEKQYFDLEISLDVRIPVVHYANVERLPNTLLNYIEKLVDFDLGHRDLIIQAAYKDSITNNVLSDAKKWYQHPDIVSEFNLTEDFLLSVKLDHSPETLLKFKLTSNQYITINREIGDDEIKESTKLWPMNYYRELIEKIKATYPQYKIIEIGTGKGERIGNTHENLAGKTSLEEIKVILKHAALHIDSEGGLVHLRHALKGGPSLVFFGPSSPEVLGYSENLNLRSEACPICCEFYSNTWQQSCLKGKRVCMESLHPNEVFEQLKKRALL